MMTDRAPDSDFSLALVSTPWPLYNRPSIQLGVLKAYLNRRRPGIRVDSHHLYLHVACATDYAVYNAVAERTWLAESVYAALLYPERFRRIESFFKRQARGKPILEKVDFGALTGRVETATRRYLQSVNWQSYQLVGLSICLCQFSASLYVIRLLNRLRPDMPIVVGGSLLAEKTARQMLQVFPEIRFAVTGEGERPLLGLVDHLRDHRGHRPDRAIPGVIQPESDPVGSAAPRCQLDDLKDLPCPDYDDYFAMLQGLPAARRFFPTLAAEMSRGCWWKRSGGRGPGQGCAFCNLNLQWQGYRTKSTRQVADEVDYLTSRFKALHVAFVDNLIPAGAAPKIFERLAGLQKDLHLFCEIRADTPRRTLAKMHAAGVREVQVGIEALSDSLLKRLNKGSSVIQNLEVMKHCEELGLLNCANLILQFPGSDAEDVHETLRNIEFAACYRPLQGVVFWLGLESPVWQQPQRYGILSRFNHPNWAHLLPRQVRANLTLIIQAYRGDRGRQARLWQPVARQLAIWQENYRQLRSSPESPPVLSYRDGRDFLIIRQLRPGADPLTHRLTGTSRRIYLYCRQTRHFEAIAKQFQAFKPPALQSFLDSMIAKRLMFTANDKYLSLAVAVRPQE